VEIRWANLLGKRNSQSAKSYPATVFAVVGYPNIFLDGFLERMILPSVSM
jgi:hypothetical protein